MAEYTFLDKKGFTEGLTQFWKNVKTYYSKDTSTSPTVFYAYKSDILATPRTFSIASTDSVITTPEVEFNGSNNVVLHTTIDDAKSATDTTESKHGLMSAGDKYKFDKLKKINYITETIAENEDHYSRIAKLKFEESTGTLSILLPYYALKTDLNKVFKFKGVVDTLTDLNAIASPEIGDVYHVSENHYDYVWAEGKPDSPIEEDRKDHWESLGPNQDMENYYTKGESDSLLKEEREARISADSTLTDNLNTEIVNRKQAIIDLNTSLTNTINTKEKALQDSLAEETTNRENADKALDKKLDKEISDRKQAISDLTTATNNALKAEAEIRLNADEVLQSNINSEANTREANDITLQSNINTLSDELKQADSNILEKLSEETDTRKSEDDILQSALNTEISNRESAIESEATARTNADNQLSEDLATETKNRTSADNTLQDNITAEENARIADVEALTTALGTETTNRKSADTDLDTKKANKLATANGNILKADTNGDLADTSVSSTNLYKIDNGEVVSGNDRFVTGGQVYTSISNLESDTATKLDELTNKLKTESETREADDNTLTTNLNNEIETRKSDVSKLTIDLSTEITNRTNADTDILNKLSDEVTTRETKDSELKSAIDKEISDRKEAINSLDVSGTSTENDGQFVFDVSETDGKINVTRKSLDEDLTKLGTADTKLPVTSKAVKTYVDSTETTYKFTSNIDGKFVVTPYIGGVAQTSETIDTGAVNKLESVDVVGTDDKSVTLAIENRKVTIDFEQFIAKIDDTSISTLVANGSYS